MKKILFAIKGMYLGGTEKAMLSLLNNMDMTNYEVTILLLDKEGALLNDLPKSCKVKYIEDLKPDVKDALLRNGFVSNVKYYLKHFRLIKAFKIAWRRIVCKDLLAEMDGAFKKVNAYPDSFDIAISYQFHNVFMTRYVAEKIKADKKIVWVHNDLTTTKFDTSYTKDYIDNFNTIYAVSNTIEKELKKAYLKLSKKIHTKYNYFEYDDIRKKSKESVKLPYNKDKLSILSVGRLNKQKGFDIAIESAKQLVDSGVDFEWFIIGEGEERSTLESMIKQYSLEDRFILLGAKSNPFPYMVGCDLYVQTSRHEGFCTTTREALALKKVVVSTDVSGANEQIRNGVNGFIVEIDASSIANKIIELNKNKDTLDKITDYLKNNNDDDQSEFYDFLG